MEEAKLAFQAKNILIQKSEEDRTNAILSIAKGLGEYKEQILLENQKDINEAKKLNLNSALIDRLILDENRIENLVKAVKSIAHQPAVLGEITEEKTREDGLLLQKQRIPLGVIGMIFESRPNVVVDCSCLAIKSGNSIILKGGKEAKYSNKILGEVVRNSIAPYLPTDCIQVISSRDEVSELLNQVGLVDVIIPRGGEKLIETVYKNSKIPVIAHFKGLCHTFIDESANLEWAKNIILNAKIQRPGVCNAMETLLLHKNLPENFIQSTLKELEENGVELRICKDTQFKSEKVKQATPQDWDTEYLDTILSVKTVNSITEAIDHIRIHGTNHSECIVSKNQENIKIFQTQVDASSIMVNCSTRFNDGGEYGLGAELGISTTKLHSYGPMGAKEITTQRYLVTGQGHIRK